MRKRYYPYQKPKVALVIGAGGVKCAASLGMFRILQRFNIDVDFLAGCSGGSIYAALLAMGFRATEVEKIITDLWTREITHLPNRSSYLMSLMPKNKDFIKKFALRKDYLIWERLCIAFGDHLIEETNIPLVINATDFQTGNPELFTSGKIVDAVRASIAIPSIFRPWEINGKLYSDGILSNPLPIDVAAIAGADIIVAVGFDVPIMQRVHNTSRFNRHVNTILTNNLLRSKVEQCEQAYDADVFIVEPEFNGRVGIFDTEKIPDIIAAGENSMKKMLPELDMCLQKRTTLYYQNVGQNGVRYASLQA